MTRPSGSPATRRRSEGRRWTARLVCGRLLEYEAPDLVPEVGDVVPCRRHGHCTVATAATGRTPLRGRRPEPRTGRELVELLHQRGPMSLAALRQARFSLRLAAEVERAGLVHVDHPNGVVVLTEQCPTLTSLAG